MPLLPSLERRGSRQPTEQMSLWRTGQYHVYTRLPCFMTFDPIAFPHSGSISNQQTHLGRGFPAPPSPLAFLQGTWTAPWQKAGCRWKDAKGTSSQQGSAMLDLDYLILTACPVLACFSTCPPSLVTMSLFLYSSFQCYTHFHVHPQGCTFRTQTPV